MTTSNIAFVDHPDVDPCEEDNPICAQTCPVRGRYRDDGHCFLTTMPTLRYAILCGYTEEQGAAAYPAEWLDQPLSLCRKGHGYLRISEHHTQVTPITAASGSTTATPLAR